MASWFCGVSRRPELDRYEVLAVLNICGFMYTHKYSLYTYMIAYTYQKSYLVHITFSSAVPFWSHFPRKFWTEPWVNDMTSDMLVKRQYLSGVTQCWHSNIITSGQHTKEELIHQNQDVESILGLQFVNSRGSQIHWFPIARVLLGIRGIRG